MGRKNLRQNLILNLGYETYLSDKQKRKELADCLQALFKGQHEILYETTSDKKLQESAFKYFDRFLKQEQRTDNRVVEKTKNQGSDWQSVNINNVEVGEAREIGSEWLCYQACRQFGLNQLATNRYQAK